MIVLLLRNLCCFVDGEILGVQSGTVLHSDGIIVTSAHCLRSLKNTEVKVTVGSQFFYFFSFTLIFIYQFQYGL